jgi:hypothetical protein
MERFDQLIAGTAKSALLLAAIALFIWALAIFCLQCLCWLKFGVWQPVPAFAAFLTPAAQSYQLVPLGLFEAHASPLMAVPSVLSFDSSEAISTAFGGPLLGVAKIIGSLLALPLSASLVAVAAAFSWGASLIEDVGPKTHHVTS